MLIWVRWLLVGVVVVVEEEGGELGEWELELGDESEERLRLKLEEEGSLSGVRRRRRRMERVDGVEEEGEGEKGSG